MTVDRRRPTERSLRKARILAHPDYAPVRLINHAAHLLRAQNDNQLAELLEYDHGQLSRVRHRKDVVSATLIVAILDRTDLTIGQVRELAGIPFDLELHRPGSTPQNVSVRALELRQNEALPFPEGVQP
jgi:hypothetical protein